VPARLLPPRVAVGVLALLVLSFVLLPWPLELKVRALGFGLDPQRSHHSFIFDGEPMPIEARKVGIYAGFALAAGWLAWRASRAARLPPGGYLAALLGVMVMGLDGTNALLYDLGAPHLYAPRLDLRLATGLTCGLAMAALLWPVWAQAAWKSPHGSLRLPLFLPPFFLAFLVFLALVTGQAWLALPISLLATAGLIGVVALINGVVLLILMRREGAAETVVDFLDIVALMTLLAVVELLALAALRYALIGTMPLP
jgi:uncharacterized membrane protein